MAKCSSQSVTGPHQYLSWKNGEQVNEGLFLSCLLNDLFVYLFHIWMNHCTSVIGTYTGYSCQ